jgi:hypothetical protein
MQRTVLLTSGALGFVLCLVVACGSSDDSTFGNPNGDGGDPGFTDGALGDGLSPDGGDPYANDLPPPNCPAPNTEACCASPNPPTTPIGGTTECPDDKNKPHCACTTPGQTAACWTGLRKNRGLGVCKDGQTTCQKKDETTYEWGDCVGEVLPTPGATKGTAACGCFSAGQWLLSNLSPCFFQYCDVDCSTDPAKSDPTQCDADGNCTAAHTTGLYSLSTVNSTPAACPAFNGLPAGPPAKPAAPWSTTKLKVDCTGHFTLCYELKVGDAKNPKPTDCSLTKVCAPPGDYLTANVEQDFGPLDSWVSPDQACAKAWRTTGGYGEMSVKGLSTRCEKIDDGAGNSFVFNRVQYCPTKCENPAHASDPECVNCKQDGSGQF